MATRSRSMLILVVLAGLAALTACGDKPLPTAEALHLPIAQTPPPPGGSARANAGGTAGGTENTDKSDLPDDRQPVPEPTVAKTQKWVKIFSGPSTRNLEPNADKRKGSHTVELDATTNDQIGTYVTDGAGRTLYRFDNDKAKPPKSTCNGSCAIAWPPLLVTSPGKIYPKGIDPQLIGYVERADGHCQVTIAGWPVYYFIADSKPGDINGQGLNGKWFAIAPDGTRTKPIPGFPLSSGGSSSGNGSGNGK
jgi:predicted lipoprotein with Yx(FWY)xxD motif/predicted small lipoprotein YifL